MLQSPALHVSSIHNNNLKGCLPFSTAPSPERCTYGDVQIFDGASLFLNNRNRIIVGIPQICTNDTYIPVCNESLTVDIARRMCRQFNYDDGIIMNYS